MTRYALRCQYPWAACRVVFSRYPRVPMANPPLPSPPLFASARPFADKNQKTDPNKDAP